MNLIILNQKIKKCYKNKLNFLVRFCFIYEMYDFWLFKFKNIHRLFFVDKFGLVF